MIEDFISSLLKPFKKDKKKQSLKDSTIDSDSSSQLSPSAEDEIVEYHEVLYSDQPMPGLKKHALSSKRLFTAVDSIEADVDEIDGKREAENGAVEKRVDTLLSQKKQKLKKSISRKPANVVYVVSKPQPGQVKGDWAVRTHRKIYSHHRTKQAAIKKARSIALDRDATVLVQNMDGTFSDGFKPRKKKKNTE